MSNECPKSFGGPNSTCEACGHSRARVLAEGCPKADEPTGSLLSDLASRVAGEKVAEQVDELDAGPSAKVLIVCAEAGDWEGLYIDGELVKEGHSLTVCEVLEALGIEHESFSIEMDAYGLSNLPLKAANLPQALE